MSLDFQTFGCKVNTYDTGLLQGRLKDLQVEQDVRIINTCAVTAEATSEAIRAARKIKRESPDALIVVTGCSAQVDTERFDSISEVDLVVANSHKGMISDLIQNKIKGNLEGRVFKSNIFKKEDLEMGGGLEESHSRSFLKIQDGCNSFCTYCVIPYARGKSRSVPMEAIAQRVTELSVGGVQEVVLTGIHIGDYEPSLEALVEYLLLKTRIPRIRLTSLEPVEISDRLLDTFSDERMCAHFHMSIQSATTSVLQRMKRKYTAEDVETALIKIDSKVNNAFVGMDVITGFCGETDADFNETATRLQSLPWTRIHVFPYSERPGTRAAKEADDVPGPEKKRRSKLLRELSSDRYQKMAINEIGRLHKVLPLSGKKSNFGLSRNFWSTQIISPKDQSDLQISSDKDRHQKELTVKITGFDQSNPSRMDGILVGTVI
jgi:threonylcarbamoyladenosine tRNA methylthiotransferase MtaB